MLALWDKVKMPTRLCQQHNFQASFKSHNASITTITVPDSVHRHCKPEQESHKQQKYTSAEGEEQQAKTSTTPTHKPLPLQNSTTPTGLKRIFQQYPPTDQSNDVEMYFDGNRFCCPDRWAETKEAEHGLHPTRIITRPNRTTKSSERDQTVWSLDIFLNSVRCQGPSQNFSIHCLWLPRPNGHQLRNFFVLAHFSHTLVIVKKKMSVVGLPV